MSQIMQIFRLPPGNMGVTAVDAINQEYYQPRMADLGHHVEIDDPSDVLNSTEVLNL